MDLTNLKQRVLDGVDAGTDRAIALSQAIGKEPELGYREERTARKVERAFESLGLQYRNGLALTGVKAVLRGGKPGPTVALIGELDALPISNHPDFNPQTGGIHACGHHCQVGSVVAAAAGLQASGVLDELAGNVVLFAVPAEESVEVEWRLEQKAAGRIEFLGGKAELIKRGEFDDIDLAMMVHTNTSTDFQLAISDSTNGHVIKFVRFIGKSAHSGAAPHNGINALKAAMLAMNAIDAQRETFKDADSVRIHPILTRGGDVVNAVPADARLESFCRGVTIESIADASMKFDRAMRAGAMAIGAEVEIVTLPGYMPMIQNPAMNQFFFRNAETVVGASQVAVRGPSAAATDMGDLSQILPAIHPAATGASGNGHGADFRIENWHHAVINPGKALALTVVDLLANEAAAAREILARDTPRMKKDDYLTFLRSNDTLERWKDEGSKKGEG